MCVGEWAEYQVSDQGPGALGCSRSRMSQAEGGSPTREALPAPVRSAEVCVRGQAAGMYVSHHLPVSWILHELLLPTPQCSRKGSALHHDP